MKLKFRKATVVRIHRTVYEIPERAAQREPWRSTEGPSEYSAEYFVFCILVKNNL